jgi:hypothetical protein
MLNSGPLKAKDLGRILILKLTKEVPTKLMTLCKRRYRRYVSPGVSFSSEADPYRAARPDQYYEMLNSR